jgi:hypothetical protein
MRFRRINAEPKCPATGTGTSELWRYDGSPFVAPSACWLKCRSHTGLRDRSPDQPRTSGPMTPAATASRPKTTSHGQTRNGLLRSSSRGTPAFVLSLSRISRSSLSIEEINTTPSPRLPHAAPVSASSADGGEAPHVRRERRGAPVHSKEPLSRVPDTQLGSVTSVAAICENRAAVVFRPHPCEVPTKAASQRSRAQSHRRRNASASAAFAK